MNGRDETRTGNVDAGIGHNDLRAVLVMYIVGWKRRIACISLSLPDRSLSHLDFALLQDQILPDHSFVNLLNVFHDGLEM